MNFFYCVTPLLKSTRRTGRTCRKHLKNAMPPAAVVIVAMMVYCGGGEAFACVYAFVVGIIVVMLFTYQISMDCESFYGRRRAAERVSNLNSTATVN